jgi:hypothetical protein
MVRENSSFSIKSNLVVAALAWGESCPLLAQPPPELTVLHKNPSGYTTKGLCNKFVVLVKGKDNIFVVFHFVREHTP